MANEKNSKYPLDATIIAGAEACSKGMCCLENGPKCRVGAILNKNTLIVDCQDKVASCPFYQASSSSAGSSDRGICTCPVRFALHNKYGL
jgi:hypothetical protein